MRNMRLAVAVALTCAVSPALAQNQAEIQTQDGTLPTVPGRYTFSRVDDGFLRLDNSSGQIAFCSPHSVGWVCQAVPEDRAALEKEIARLQDEVASLKKENATLREPLPRPPVDLTPPSDQSVEVKKLSEDIERARVAIEGAWRRLVDMIVNFQKDMMHKG
jgi:hypothetical protein